MFYLLNENKKDMLDQVIQQYQDAPYIHIGCDEVYYKLTHPNCSKSSIDKDFQHAYLK